jgi:inosose dehydratase
MSSLDFLSEGVRLAVSPLSWANDVLEDLGADTAGDLPARCGGGGIPRRRARPKIPRKEGSLRPLLDRQGLALASGWHSRELAERGVDDEMAAVAAHADLLHAMDCKVMVYGEVAMTGAG